MNFYEFSEYRTALLAARPDVLDFAETRISSTLGTFVPYEARAVPDVKAHRCHLAEFWLAHFHLPASWSARTNISEGVRDSLSRLFRVYAEQGASVAIPSDVYPRYLELAQAAGVDVQTYSTLPCLNTEAWKDARVLLLTSPVKPRGSFLSHAELADVERWLAADSRRRVVVDAVYTFTDNFSSGVLRLYETGQAILLHSLSKTWASPLLMGVALVPEADIAVLRPVFQAQAPSQDQLRRAQMLLAVYSDVPKAIAAAIEASREHARANLPMQLLPHLFGMTGYLQVVPYRMDELLDQFNVLGLPMTAFGSEREDLSVLSTLSFVQGPG